MSAKTPPQQPFTIGMDNPWALPLNADVMSWDMSEMHPLAITVPTLVVPPVALIEAVEITQTIDVAPSTFLMTDLHVVPEEAHHEDPLLVHLPTTTAASESNSAASEDPFMGFANKRASNIIDEYGWVLSHVEAL